MSFVWNRSLLNSTLDVVKNNAGFLNNNFVFDNFTNSSDYQFPTAFVASVVVTYALLFVLSLLGNCFVCVLIGFRFLKTTVTNLFIGSLAVCDVLVTVCIPFTVLSNIIFMYWPFGTFLCPVISVFQLMTILLRALTLVAMTCDKYYVLSRPLRRRLNTMQAKYIIIGIWMFSLICCIPVAVFSKIVYLPHEPGSNGLCVEVWTHKSLRFTYGIVLMLLQYFIPLLVMLCTYSHIAVIVWRSRAPGEANNRRDERRKQSKKKTLVMLVTVVINYLLSWLPLHVISIVGDVNPSMYDSMSVHMIWVSAHVLAFSNSATNAMIYYWRNKSYRTALTTLWKKGFTRYRPFNRTSRRSHTFTDRV